MHSVDRRQFLGAMASLAAGPHLLGQTPPDFEPVEQGGLDTIFLTWQRDPTTTMTIQWVGRHRTSDAIDISYRVAGEDGWKFASTELRHFPFTNLTAFRAELTGLTPETDYLFRIGLDPRKRYFRTMPAKATDALHFVSGGDCGVGPHTSANNVLAARQDPWFALIGGDLAYDNGNSPNTTLGWLRSYSKHMIDSDGRMIPMVVCIGNHEVDGGFDQPRSRAPLFNVLFDGLFRERTFATLDFGDYLSLVLLDSGHIAPIGGEQTSWLDRALADRADLPHLIAVNHVPAYPSFRKMEGAEGKAGTGALNRKHWVPLFEKHNVDLVLEHHDHTFKRTHPLKDGRPDKNGILYLGDGSWGRLRAPQAPQQRPYLAAVHESYHLTLHRLEGEQRFHMALEEGGRVVDVCATGRKPRHRVVG